MQEQSSGLGPTSLFERRVNRCLRCLPPLQPCRPAGHMTCRCSARCQHFDLSWLPTLCGRAQVSLSPVSTTRGLDVGDLLPGLPSLRHLCCTAFKLRLCAPLKLHFRRRASLTPSTQAALVRSLAAALRLAQPRAAAQHTPPSCPSAPTPQAVGQGSGNGDIRLQGVRVCLSLPRLLGVPEADPCVQAATQLWMEGVRELGAALEGCGCGEVELHVTGGRDWGDAPALPASQALVALLSPHLQQRLTVLHFFGHGFSRAGRKRLGLLRSIHLPVLREIEVQGICTRKDCEPAVIARTLGRRAPRLERCWPPWVSPDR